MKNYDLSLFYAVKEAYTKGVNMKFEDIKDKKYYRRGRDYPAYARKEKGSAKVSIAMSGKEIKEWFTEEELKDYPKPDAYTGPLP